MTKFTRPWDGFLHDKPMPVPENEHRPRFELESPFWPDDYDNVPRSKIPRAILNTIIDGWEEMRDEDPEFFEGITLHGSLVKGRSHDESDIDPVVYANEDAAQATLDKHGITVPDDEDPELMRYVEAKDFIDTRFRAVVGKLLESRGFPKSYSKSETWGAMLLSPDYFVSNFPQWEYNIAFCLKNDNEVFMPTPVEHLFHLRIGSGQIQTFRRQVFDGLESLPRQGRHDFGEIAWKSIARRVVQVEEWNRGATIMFPETIEEARHYFGV